MARDEAARVRAVGQPLERRLAAVMFTDMVGYTALIQADEPEALRRRDCYMDAVTAGHDAHLGTIVQRLGDGTLSRFDSALDAVLAGVAIQQRLVADDVATRVGIHVGEIIVEPERISGEAVNLASRIESFGVPGAVMVSEAVCDQVRNRPEIELVSLGRYRLKNVGRPAELFAVAAPGVTVPDGSGLEGKGERYSALPQTLPDLVSLLGRDDDLAQLRELTRTHRAVTITGPGGVGKTSVLTQLGHQLASEFSDGVGFVSLVDVTTPDEVLPRVAEALDVKEAEGRSLSEGLVTLVGEQAVLLLLDNFEQVVDAAGDVAWLLDRCRELHVVVTSRTPLHIASEHEFGLSTLPLPDENASVSAADVGLTPAVALFVRTAQAARPSFELTDENAAAVVGVCRRLDGLPLALELAAARLRLLGPDDLLARLDHALGVLTSGGRDKPSRHQTLRATIDWSHAQLSAAEQQVFRRLAVFPAGGTLPDVEAVCADVGTSCLDEVESLVDHALLQVDPQTNRLRMLQTIAEFAGEQLAASGEADELTLRHASRFAEVAGELRDAIEGAHQVAGVARGVVEDANLQSAIDALLTRARAGDASATERGMRMCGDLLMYWHIRGKNVTAADYASAFLSCDAGGAVSSGRIGALSASGLAAWVLGDFDQARTLWEQALAEAQELDDEREICMQQALLALDLIGLDLDEGMRHATACLQRVASTPYRWTEAFARTIEGFLHAVAGDVAAARAGFEAALAMQRTLEDMEGAGLSLGGLAALAAAGDDLASALSLYDESLAAFAAIGDRAEEARVLDEGAWVVLRSGDTAGARDRSLAAAQAYLDVASVRGVGLAMIGLAAADALDGRAEQAVTLAAAADVYASSEGIVNLYSDEAPGHAHVERARGELDASALAAAEAAGRRLPLNAALDLARASR